MRSIRHAAAIVLLATTVAGGSCEDTGAGESQQKPIVELPKSTKGGKLEVRWEPAAQQVDVHFLVDGSGRSVTVSGGEWNLDVMAKNHIGLQATWHGHVPPRRLYCHIQVGWRHYEMSANVDNGQWSCWADWRADTKVPTA
jgi:hypothetical protein